jgi:integrase
MATFKIWLDKRNPKNKKGEFNLTIRACLDNKSRYLNITKMTEKNYHLVFEKRSTDTESIEFRNKCNTYITKCERIYEDLKPFDYDRFRELFYAAEKEVPTTLRVKDLFDHYIKEKDIKLRTKAHIQASSNIWCSYKSGLTVWDVTPEFLKKFEKTKLDAKVKISTINSYHRDLRAVLNYFMKNHKLIPSNYEYPYGNAGYSVKNAAPKTNVMSNEEIQKVLDCNDYESAKQRWARDVWSFLYYCNGVNFVDLLRLRWDDRKGDYFIITRKKTETTRRNHIKPVVIPIIDELKNLIEIIGDKNSPFVLGQLKEGYADNTFENRCHKLAQQINRELTKLSQKLELSIPLKLQTARDAYSMTLRRAKVSKDDIGDMLNHGSSLTTEHYLSSMDLEDTFKINSHLLKKTRQKTGQNKGKKRKNNRNLN